MRRFIDILIVVVLLFACGCTDTTTPEQEAQVVLKSLSITPRSITFVVGGYKSLKVVTNPVVEGLTFTWSSTNSSVATVNEQGVVKAHAEGTAEIICSYNDQISARCSVTVIPRTEPEPEPEPYISHFRMPQKPSIGPLSIHLPTRDILCFIPCLSSLALNCLLVYWKPRSLWNSG